MVPRSREAVVDLDAVVVAPPDLDAVVVAPPDRDAVVVAPPDLDAVVVVLPDLEVTRVVSLLGAGAGKLADVVEDFLFVPFRQIDISSTEKSRKRMIDLAGFATR